MTRRLVTYDDIAELTGQKNAVGLNGEHSTQSINPTKITSSSTSSDNKRLHWNDQGQPVTASASRKYKKVLQLLANGEIENAETMLKRIGPEPQKSSEVQEAIIWAKKKRNDAGNIPLTSEKQTELNGINGKVSDKGGLEEETQETEGSTQSKISMAGKGTNQKTLSHAEIWDDSALIDAWDAAMEEYKQFDVMRKAAASEKAIGKRSREEEIEKDGNSQPGSKRSMLWHDSPNVGSKTGATSKEHTSSNSGNEDVLRQRKLEAKELLASILGEEEEEEIEEEESLDEDEGEEEETDVIERGNIDISNPIGSTSNIDSNQKVHSNKSKQPANTNQQQTLSQEEVLQNLAMSWYYAGYYQAMAMQMSQK